MVRFFVEGVPVPQGSKVCKCLHGKAIMWEANSKLKTWRDTVTAQAQIEMIARGLQSMEKPLDVTINFLMPKPKTVKRDLPAVKPDIDKLVRAVLDGLTKSGIYKDDAQVVFLEANKFYADSEVGCWILVNEIEDV